MHNEDDAISYVIEFLVGKNFARYVSYGSELSAEAKISIIRSSFFDEGVYGTAETLPKTPFAFLPETDIPFLFGSPKVERTDGGHFVLHADLVASAFFMLSRYEETIKPECRDMYGRFLAKDAVVFQQGYGMRPLVDEWGRYLRNLLRQSGIDVPAEKKGFSKIWLTHDVDVPFMIPDFKTCIFETARTVLHRKNCLRNPIGIYLSEKKDPLYTFPWLIKQDGKLKEKLGGELVESVYFLIAGKSTKKNKYCSVKSKKYIRLLKLLKKNNSTLGLHVSHEGGENPSVIKDEIERLPSCVDRSNLFSRHHYLKWCEPEHIDEMQAAGIKHDFTLEYADCVGFRTGTCRPYRFINPKNLKITSVAIHSMQIMECSLQAKQYMGFSLDEAKNIVASILNYAYDFCGEVNILFHNTSFFGDEYYVKLYEYILEFLSEVLSCAA